MATPSLTKHQVPGALGDVLVDVRAADRRTPGPAVLILHGFKGFKDWGMFPPFADRLARAGFVAVSFNVSGSGVDDHGDFTYPDRFGHNSFSAEIADVSAVLDALDGGGLGLPRPASVGIVGHSRGGGVAILAARRLPRLRAVVTWAAISTVDRWTEEQRRDWRSAGKIDVVNSRTGQVLPIFTDVLTDIETHADVLDIEAAAEAIRRPWLIVHGDQDESVPVREAERLAAAAGGEPSRLLRVAGAGHTFGAVHPFAGMTPALEQVFDASAAMLAGALS